MKFSIKFPADLVTFTEEILNGKFHFLVQCWLKKTIKTDSQIVSRFTKRKIVFVCMKKLKTQEERSSLLSGFA